MCRLGWVPFWRRIWRGLDGSPAVCAFFFHFSNAAMLPQLGEMLSRGSRASAAPFMLARIVVTQVVIMCSAAAIGRYANVHGRKPLLLLGFGVLPVRAALYTLTHNTAGLIAIQLLDGVANAIFGVVAVLVGADRTRGTGRFNLVQGALATAIGLGAALSTTFCGKADSALQLPHLISRTRWHGGDCSCAVVVLAFRRPSGS